MDDALGYSDDSEWEGLVCPPLEEFAFNFDDTSCYKLDGIFDESLLDYEEKEEVVVSTAAKVLTQCYGRGKELKLQKPVLKVKNILITGYEFKRVGLDHTSEVVGINKSTNQAAGVDKKSITHRYENYGKGKVLKQTSDMAENRAFHEEETEQIVEKKDKKRKSSPCYDSQSKKRKDSRPLDQYSFRLAGVDNMMKADFDQRLEAPEHKSRQLTCQLTQQKDRKRQDNANQIGVVDSRRKVDRLMTTGTCRSNKKFQPFVY